MHYLILMFAACVAQSPSAPRGGELPSKEANNVVCGPRCVQRVLQHYGQKVELIDLVIELQGAAIDRPANLADMKSALERRGVYAMGVRVRSIDRLASLDWTGPVITHFSADGGHFRVIFPARSDANSTCVWDGLAGATMLPIAEIATESSGVHLLTSGLPIDECLQSSDSRRMSARLAVAVVSATILVCISARYGRASLTKSCCVILFVLKHVCFFIREKVR